MPLQKAILPISFTRGVDTGSDPKQTALGTLLTLENGQFVNEGQITKRSGYDSLEPNVEGSANLISLAISGGQTAYAPGALTAYGDELLLFTGSRLYSRLTATSKWIDKGPAPSALVSQSSVSRSDTFAQSNPDGAYASGVELYAWEDSRGGVHYAVVDSATGAKIVVDAVASTSASRPQCLAFNGSLYLFYADTTTLKGRVLSPSAPTVLGPEVTIEPLLNSSRLAYAVAATGSSILVAAMTQTASTVRLRTCTTALAVANTTSLSSLDAVALDLTADAAGNVWLATATATAVSVGVYSYLGSPIVPTVTVEALAGVARVTVAPWDPGTGQAQVFYEVPNGTLSYVRQARVTWSGSGSGATVSVPSVLKRGVGLASQAWTYNGKTFVVVVHPSQYQATYFTLDGAGTIVSRHAPGLSGGLRAGATLAGIQTLSPGVFQLAGECKGRIQSDTGTLFSRLGIGRTRLDFTTTHAFLGAASAGLQCFVGGFASVYDGAGASEHNFHLWPEGTTAAVTNTGGALGLGQYQYQVCYEWTDALGQVHRSAPSITVTVTTVTATSQVTLTVPMLRLTAKAGVRVVLYRTEVNGTLFYRITSTSAPLLNDPALDTLTYVDAAADTAIVTNDLLYTTGTADVGIPLDNAPFPACALMTSHQGRVFVAGLEDKSEVRYSHEATFGLPVDTNELLSLRTDRRHGDITALASMDSYLVVFMKRAVAVVTGQGPNRAGVAGAFSTPQLVSTDTGCVNPNSVVLTPQGLMFRSEKGIYLLGRDLQVTYVGHPVEGFAGLTITSATLVASKNQVRFLTQEGTGLVYAYNFGQWSVFTNHASVDAEMWRGQFVFLRKDSRVYAENTARFDDNGASIKLRIQTGWLALSGLQAVQRVYRAVLLGDYRGPHSLAVSVAYDYAPSAADTAQVDAGGLIGGLTYGSGVYGGSLSSDVYGGLFSPYQFRYRIARQKCEAIQFTIEDVQSGPTFYEGYALSALSLEVGQTGKTSRSAPLVGV